jgi:hypothetical protein
VLVDIWGDNISSYSSEIVSYIVRHYSDRNVIIPAYYDSLKKYSRKHLMLAKQIQYNGFLGDINKENTVQESNSYFTMLQGDYAFL